MHVNVKPPYRNALPYRTEEEAIRRVIVDRLYPQQHWQDVHFGRDLADIRKATDAIKAEDASAFKASLRRGYWRVELAI